MSGVLFIYCSFTHYLFSLFISISSNSCIAFHCSYLITYCSSILTLSLTHCSSPFTLCVALKLLWVLLSNHSLILLGFFLFSPHLFSFRPTAPAFFTSHVLSHLSVFIWLAPILPQSPSCFFTYS